MAFKNNILCIGGLDGMIATQPWRMLWLLSRESDSLIINIV